MSVRTARQFRSAPASVLGLLIVMAAVAAQGQTQITTCGASITAPGHYVLANDLNCGTGNGIDIHDTRDIELRLAGHRITGSSSDSGVVIWSDTDVRVLGPGTINGFRIGVDVRSSYRVVVTGVTSVGASYSGFGVFTSDADLHSNTASNALNGFQICCEFRGELSGNTANENDTGFLVAPGTEGSSIHDNTALKNRSTGILVFSGVSGNRIEFNTSLGNSTDLVEENITCYNHWERNIYQTANLVCIK